MKAKSPEKPALSKRGAIVIQEVIGRSPLGPEAFSVTLEREDWTGQVAEIVFRAENEWFFQVYVGTDPEDAQETQWQAIQCPSEHLKMPSMTRHARWDRVLNQLGLWLDLVNEEAQERLDEFRVFGQIDGKLKEWVTGMVNDPHQTFSREEVEEWQEKLEKLADRVREMEAKHEINEDRMKAAEASIAELKTSLAGTTKKHFAGKLSTFIHEVLMKATVSAVLEGGKAMLPLLGF